MKKILSFILAAMTVLTLASCSAKKGSGDYYVYNDAPSLGVNIELEGGGVNAPAGDDAASGTDYEKLIENAFTDVTKTPVSTFSADVDTASYAYFRKLVDQGYKLDELIATAGNNIRTEEMINYFTYNGNQPKDGELFGVKSVIADCPWNPEAKLLALTLNTEKAIAKQKNNLVFLIDVSGSMNSHDKLELLKDSFSYLIDSLGEDDVISIVTYSGAEKVVLEGCEGNKSETIRNALKELNASGSTNGQAGIQKAYEIAEEYFISDGNNRIIMASDGDLNVGISNTEDLKRFIEEKRNNGIYLSVLGFGSGNYRDSMMETIADNGNGVYYYIDSELEAEKVFCTDLLSTLYTVASDVKLQITFNPDSVSQYRLVGYENRLLNEEDFKDDTKDAGDLGTGHSVTVCYELITTEAAENNSEWMKLAVRHKKPGEDKSNETQYIIGKESLTDAPDDDFNLVTAVAGMSLVIRESEYIKNEFNVDSVLGILDDINLNDEYKTQFKGLIEKLK